jgi:hypothetical protein
VTVSFSNRTVLHGGSLLHKHIWEYFSQEVVTVRVKSLHVFEIQRLSNMKSLYMFLNSKENMMVLACHEQVSV